MTLLIYSVCMVSRFAGYLIFYHQMHELGNPPTEVVGEGNMMVPNFAELGNLGQVSFIYETRVLHRPVVHSDFVRIIQIFFPET